MQNKRLCPLCGEEIPPASFICRHCGLDLHSSRLFKDKTSADFYEVVPDGEKFGLALEGEIKVHGLDLQEAEITAKIFNMMALELAG
jgi:predicted amidophosphoribosyltransferase